MTEMSDKWAYIAFGMVWVAVALAISVGIYVSNNWKCLFFFIIPAMYSVKTHNKEEKDE